MIDSKKIRNDFPQLDGEDNHYLDAAATSLTPQAVLDAVIDYYTHSRANVHRGLFPEALRATDLYEAARQKVAAFINAEPDEIIFTSGATESSNMLVRMIDESMPFTEEENKDIVTTVMEHHGALIPLQEFAFRRAIPIVSIPLSGTELDYQKTEEIITDNTILVSAMLASNVTGAINDVARIADVAHAHHALMVVDATAAVGHIPVDVKTLGCDALYFSGHKMLAPTGVGVLWAKKEVLARLTPSSFGGHMVSDVKNNKAEWAEIPERFEAGTKNIAGVIGLGAAIDYIQAIGIANIRAHTQELAAYLIARLGEIPGVVIVAEDDVTKNVGIVSFSCEWAHPHDIAEILAREHVAVRAGHHCAIPLHNALGIASSVRASFHVYNTKEDIDSLIEGVLKARTIFK
jgi:cysteine desulfurase/selenocysteine lyase